MKTSHLGQKSPLYTQYRPELLEAIPRKLCRSSLTWDHTTTLPFNGVDIWRSYELSWLDPQGKPQIACLQLTIYAHSTFLIESKSLKLYLGSFQQTSFANHQEVRQRICDDLSRCSQSQVEVELLTPQTWQRLLPHQNNALPGHCLDDLAVAIESYHPDANLLKIDTEKQAVAGSTHEDHYYSHLLQSNCPVTQQPDHGSIWIHAVGHCAIEAASLLKYIVSYRKHTSFHEVCIEQIFLDLLRTYQPQKLSIYALYNRRGGIDINPWRSYHAKQPADLRTMRQ